MGTRWEGVLAPINQPTGDGRRMAVGAFTHRPLPLPLRWQRPETQGHDDAVVVGSIDKIRIDDEAGHVWGEGELFDDANPATNPQLAEDVSSAKYLLDKQVIGPSVDPGHAAAIQVMAGTGEAVTDETIRKLMMAGATEMPPTETLFTSYEIAGATLVPVPAFAECRPLTLLSADAPALTASEVRSSGWSSLPIAPRDHRWDAAGARQRLAADCGLDGDTPDWDCYAGGFLYRYTDRDPNTREAYSFPVVDIIGGEKTLVPDGVYAAANVLSGGHGGTDIPAGKQQAMRNVVAKLYKRLAAHFDDPSIQAPWSTDKTRMALTAAEMRMVPEELFEDPKLDRLTAITRRPLPSGWTHVFGHVAEHDTCLVGQRGTCTTPPYSGREYSSFHRYHDADGLVFPLPVGRLTAGFGTLENACRCCPGNDDHACANISFGAAVAHHDRMQPLAYIRVGEDEQNNAIWFSGIEAPGVDERGQALLARQKISGDWRDVAGDMELSEVLVLNRRNPGFPLPRATMRNGRARALTAAGVIRLPMVEQMQTVDTLASETADGGIDYDRLGAVIASKLMAAAGTPTLEDVIDQTKANALENIREFEDGDADAEVDEIDEVDDDELVEEDDLEGDEVVAITAAAPEGGHTGAMLALRMTDQDAARLCVHDGLPMEELHSTLAYLGEADKISPEVRERMVKDVTKLASKVQPFEVEAADISVFNPGTNNDREPALVLGLTGEPLAELYGSVSKMNWDGYEMPSQFSPYKPHITLRQPAGDLERAGAVADRMGPVTFDRLRLAFAGDVIDIPLGGGEKLPGGPITKTGGGYDIGAAESMMGTGHELRARAALAQMELFGFNKGQRRGPDGKWIKGGGLGGGSSAPSGGAGGAGRRDAIKAEAAENAAWLRKQPHSGKADANYIKRITKLLDEAVAAGDEEKAAQWSDILENSNKTHTPRREGRGRPPFRGEDGAPADSAGGTRAQRDEYNTALRDVAQRMISKEHEGLDTDDPDYSEDDDFGPDSDLDELDNVVSDLDDAITSGDQARADRLADEIRERLRVQWLMGDDELPTRPN